MCGFLNWFGERGDESRLRSGLNAIAHRGPDDSGVEQDGFAWMGFRRLSILDLHPTGHQPMKFGGGRYWLTFNGEIYNFAELRQKFLVGVDLRSTGDTAVLGAMLERMPLEKVLQELRGMFAFVWYDSRDRKVSAARDHFGIKPMYFTEAAGSLGIASEMRSLDEATAYTFPHDPAAIRDYFRWGAVQAPRTILEGINSLLPGHLLTWSADAPVEIHKWFSPQWAPETGSGTDWIQETRKAVLDSVKAHLVSDVPVGIFLSSGLDSTLIGGAIRELGGNDLTAFSIGYEDDSGVEDESRDARRTADFLGAEFHAEVIGPRKIADEFDNFINSLDQPTGDGLNTFLVSKMTAPHVKVALSGLGADELFSGYTFHRALIAAEAMGLRSPLFRNFIFPLAGKVAQQPWLAQKSVAARRIASLSRMLGERSAAGYHRQARGTMTESSLGRLLGEASQLSVGADFALDETSVAAVGGTETAHQLLALEISSYLPNTLLRDNDCVSMAHSLELRTPFVDRDIFRLSSRMPAELKLDRKCGKKILREAFENLLPPWIKDERRKKTFTLPLMKWLRSPFWKGRIDSVLRSENSVVREMGGGAELDAQLSFFHGGTAHDKSNWLASQRIWQALVFEEWCLRRKERAASAKNPQL
jgi:asparagine synthase (glutamine-hydrolysing)